MRAPISVIVPTLNAGVGLHHTLSCLMEAVDAGLIREVIVSDAGSTDQTLEIAKDWGADVVSGPPSRGGQLRRGCIAAKGEWLLILHADTVLSGGWSAAVGKHLHTGQATVHSHWTFRHVRTGGFPSVRCHATRIGTDNRTCVSHNWNRLFHGCVSPRDQLFRRFCYSSFPRFFRVADDGWQKECKACTGKIWFRQCSTVLDFVILERIFDQTSFIGFGETTYCCSSTRRRCRGTTGGGGFETQGCLRGHCRVALTF